MKKSILIAFLCLTVFCLIACGKSKSDKAQDKGNTVKNYFECLEKTLKADSYNFNLKEYGKYDNYDGYYSVYRKDDTSYLGYTESMDDDEEDVYYEYFYIDKIFFENKSSKWSDDVEVKYYGEDDFDSVYSSAYKRYKNLVALEGNDAADIMDALIASQNDFEVPSYSVYKEAITKIVNKYMLNKSDVDFVDDIEATDSKFEISMNAVEFYKWCGENIDKYEIPSSMTYYLENKNAKKVTLKLAITVKDGYAIGFEYIHEYPDEDDTDALEYTFTNINKLNKESAIVVSCKEVVDAVKPGDSEHAMVQLIDSLETNRYSSEEYKFKVVESDSNNGYDELYVSYRYGSESPTLYKYSYNGFVYVLTDSETLSSTSDYYKADDMLAYLEDGIALPTTKELTITVWVPAEDIDSGWINRRCEAFNQLHPEWDITFKIELCSEGDSGRLVARDPSSAAAVYAFANDQINYLFSADAIAPISGAYVEAIKKDNSENMMNTVTVDGKVYGAPYSGNTWFMYYDKSVYTEEDIKSLDAMMAKRPVAFPLSNSWYGYAFYEGNGCHLNGGVNDPSLGIDIGGQKAIDVTKYIINRYNSGMLKNDDAGYGLEALANGTVGAIFSGYWDYASVKMALGDNMGIAALPSYNLNGKNVQMYSFMGSKAFGINPQSDAYSECPEALEALTVFLSNAESQLSRYEMRFLLPSSKALMESDAVAKDELAQAQYKTLEETSVLQPYNDKFNTYYWNNMVEFMQDIINGLINDSNIASEVEAFNNALNGR